MNYIALAQEALARLAQPSSKPPEPPQSPSAVESSRERSLEREDPRFVEACAVLLAMSLSQFSRQGGLIEIHVPWYPKTLWFVASDAQATLLERKGVARGRIWTAHELADVLGISSLSPTDLRTVAIGKLEFAGEIVSTAYRGDADRTDAAGLPNHSEINTPCPTPGEAGPAQLELFDLGSMKPQGRLD
jgi:hypothetical protein